MSDRRTPGSGFSNIRFLAAAWGLLVFYRLALLVAPYRLVSRVAPSRRTDAVAPAWMLTRTRWAVQTAARRSLGATCLPQAMTAQTLLSLQGFGSLIRVGVRAGPGGSFQAHAWVLSGDVVVVGDDGEQLDSFSSLIDLGHQP